MESQCDKVLFGICSFLRFAVGIIFIAANTEMLNEPIHKKIAKI